jgi:predicted lipid-binding transport protein (Tim44 family)
VLNRLRRSVATGLAHGVTRMRARTRFTRIGAGAGRHVRQREIDDLLRVARLSFVQLQAAWDRADIGAIGCLATAALLEDLRTQLAERGPGPNHTEVLSLDARLLSLEELQEAFVASVEFSGLIRERLDAGAMPFRELWLLAKIKTTGQGWQLARVQSLT